MLQKQFPLLCLFLFVLSYLFLYPTLLLITDEQSYFNLALSLLSGDPGVYLHQEFLQTHKIDLIEAEYAIGTPLLLAPIIGLLGNKSAFLVSLFCFTASYLLVYKSIKYLGYESNGVLLFFLFLPLMFISRTIMSEMPSLFIVSISLYILITNNNTHKYYWVIFLLGGISILFRETNALIFGPILLFAFFRESTIFTINKVKYSLVFLLGISARLIANHVVYDNAFHLKHGYPFSLAYIPNNLILYSIILCVIMPGGLYTIYTYRGKFHKLFLSIILLFTATHLCYGYDATDYSGYKMGLMLNGRFYIPLLPIFAIYLSHMLSEVRPPYRTWINNILGIVAITVGIGSQIYLSQITSNHRKIADAISMYNEKVLIFDHTLHSNIGRYINPYLGNINKTIDISRLTNKQAIAQIFDQTSEAFIITSERSETDEKKIRNNDIKNYIDTTLYSMNLDTTLYTGDGGVITISKIKPLQ